MNLSHGGMVVMANGTVSKPRPKPIVVLLPILIFLVMFLLAIWVLQSIVGKSSFDSVNLAFLFGVGSMFMFLGTMSRKQRAGTVFMFLGFLAWLTFMLLVFGFPF